MSRAAAGSVTVFPADKSFRTIVQWTDETDGLVHEQSFYTDADAEAFRVLVTT